MLSNNALYFLFNLAALSILILFDSTNYKNIIYTNTLHVHTCYTYILYIYIYPDTVGEASYIYIYPDKVGEASDINKGFVFHEIY